MKVIYIAGPYRASTSYQVTSNIENARRMAGLVWARGFAALCPHMNSAHMDGAAPDLEFLEGTLELMRRCDAVLMIPGWESSEGAKAERAEAERLGIPVFVDVRELAAHEWDGFDHLNARYRLVEAAAQELGNRIHDMAFDIVKPLVERGEISSAHDVIRRVRPTVSRALLVQMMMRGES